MKQISWIVLGLLAPLTSAQAASFDCSKAQTKIEKLICGDDELSKLDEDLGRAYQQALLRSGDDKPQEIKEQRFWIKIIHMSCKDTACLKELYQKRIHELAEYSYVPDHFGACE